MDADCRSRADQSVEREDEEEFDDNGLPSYDPPAQVPVGSVEVRSLSHLKGCDVGVFDKESEDDEEQEEDDNGVVPNPIPPEDNSNATAIQSSSKEEHKDSGGTAIREVSEQGNIRKQDESSLNSCEDGTSKSFVNLEKQSALQDNLTNLTLADRAEESSRRSLEQRTPDEDCLAQTTSNIDKGLTDSNEDAIKRIKEDTDKDSQVLCFDTTAGVLPTTTESGRGKLAALPDGETDELDPGPGRADWKESVDAIPQVGSGKKTSGQPVDESSDRPIDGCGNSEKNDNHSTNVAKAFAISTNLNFMFIVVVFSGLTFNRGRVEAALTVKPGDVLALSGSVARLRCSTDYPSPVYWARMLCGSDEQETIYYGKNGMARSVGDRFSVEEDFTNGRYDLVISNVQMEDAGAYVCMDEAGIGEAFQGELVVSEHFTCEMPVLRNGFMGENIFDIPEDPVESTCSLVFRGNVVPRFQWTWDSATPLVTQTVINGSTVTSSVRLRATHDLNGARLTCLSTVSAGGASSVDDSMRWTSELVSVRNVHLIFGNVAECQSSSAMIPVCNPNCTYEVQQTSDCKFQCLAVYSERGRTYNKIFNEYSCETSALPRDVVIIVVAIVSIFAIAVATGAMIVLIKFKWLRKKKESASLLAGDPSNQIKMETIKA